MKVMLKHTPPLWCLWWLDPPGPHYAEDRPGIPSSTYICGFLCKRAAVQQAANEGWEIVG